MHVWCCEEADLLRALGGSNTLSSYTRRRSTRARRIYTRVATAAGSGHIDVHLDCVVDGALESKVATTMLMLGLVRKSTLLDDAARCTCTSRTPRPALTAPRHDVTAALSGLAAQKHEQSVGASFDATVSMLDDAMVHTSRTPLRAATATLPLHALMCGV